MAILLKEMINDVDSDSPEAITESNGIPFTPYLLPGHFFSFDVNLPFAVNESMLPFNRALYESEKNEKFFLVNKPYYDISPFGLNLRIDSSTHISMLNLKVIPPVYRYKILEMYYQSAKKAINIAYDEDLIEEQMAMPDRLKENNYIGTFLGVTKGILEAMTGINLNFAINKYDISTISNVKLIDWNALPKIVKMNISSKDMIFNPGIGGMDGIFTAFESKV